MATKKIAKNIKFEDAVKKGMAACTKRAEELGK